MKQLVRSLAASLLGLGCLSQAQAGELPGPGSSPNAWYPPQGVAGPACGSGGCAPYGPNFMGIQGIHPSAGYNYSLGYCTHGPWYPHALGQLEVPPNRAWAFPFAGYTVYPGQPGSCCASQSDYSHINWTVPPTANAKGVLAKLDQLGIPLVEPETIYLGKNPAQPGKIRLPVPSRWSKEWEKEREAEKERERQALEKEKEREAMEKQRLENERLEKEKKEKEKKELENAKDKVKALDRNLDNQN